MSNEVGITDEMTDEETRRIDALQERRDADMKKVEALRGVVELEREEEARMEAAGAENMEPQRRDYSKIKSTEHRLAELDLQVEALYRLYKQLHDLLELTVQRLANLNHYGRDKERLVVHTPQTGFPQIKDSQAGTVYASGPPASNSPTSNQAQTLSGPSSSDPPAAA